MNIEKIVDEMRGLGRLLSPFVTSADEDTISLLKSRELQIEGYDIVVHYSETNIRGHHLECLQCIGVRNPFLPFSVVTKLARKYLGEEHLCFVDIFIDNKKVYCWTVSKDEDGNPIESRSVLREGNFEGVKFSYLNPKNVNFF